MTNQRQYYSIREIAIPLKVSYLTVYRWIQAGQLKSHRAGRQYRILQTELDKTVKIYKKK